MAEPAAKAPARTSSPGGGPGRRGLASLLLPSSSEEDGEPRRRGVVTLGLDALDALDGTSRSAANSRDARRPSSGAARLDVSQRSPRRRRLSGLASLLVGGGSPEGQRPGALTMGLEDSQHAALGPPSPRALPGARRAQDLDPDLGDGETSEQVATTEIDPESLESESEGSDAAHSGPERRQSAGRSAPRDEKSTGGAPTAPRARAGYMPTAPATLEDEEDDRSTVPARPGALPTAVPDARPTLVDDSASTGRRHGGESKPSSSSPRRASRKRQRDGNGRRRRR